MERTCQEGGDESETEYCFKGHAKIVNNHFMVGPQRIIFDKMRSRG